MKRFILAGLTLGLMIAVTAPVFALNTRFQDARENTMNKLNDRFKKEHQQTLDQ
jgi:hypothetical protein